MCVILYWSFEHNGKKISSGTALYGSMQYHSSNDKMTERLPDLGMVGGRSWACL